MSAERVCAVVVTFDRKALLVKCLDALLAQTHPVSELLVIDNASTDGTPEMLRERGYLDLPEVRYERLERNGGSSGGFAAGIGSARARDVDWIWVMDDDAQPATDALEMLLASPAAGDPEVAALCPAVVRPSGEVDIGHRGHFRRKPRSLPLLEYVPGSAPELGYFTFVGPLLRIGAARAADPPRADFFIWADDYEYSFRIRDQGGLRLVPESRIVHDEVGQSLSTPRSRFLNRLTGLDIDPMPLTSFWRNIYGARNFIWVKMRYEGQGPVSAWGTIAQFLLKALLYDDRPWPRLRWLVRYGRAGRRGEFVNIPPDQWRAMVERGEL